MKPKGSRNQAPRKHGGPARRYRGGLGSVNRKPYCEGRCGAQVNAKKDPLTGRAYLLEGGIKKPGEAAALRRRARAALLARRRRRRRRRARVALPLQVANRPLSSAQCTAR